MHPFAERVRALAPEGAYAVLSRAKQLAAQGHDVVHLEIGQPDFPTPEHVARAGADAILAGRTRYTQPAGVPELRQRVAEAAGRLRGVSFRAEEVVVAPGAKPMLFFPILALVQPGDEVIVPDPGFPTYVDAVRVAGATAVPVSLRDQRGFDLDAFDAALGDRTRLIVCNSPGNPTGGVADAATLAHVAAAAVRHDAWVLSDEIYSELVFDGEAPSIVGFPGMRERTVIVDGFSKAYAMTGWRLGYGIMPPALAERQELLLTHAVGCTADFTQAAGVAALTGGRAEVDAMRAAFRERRDRTVAALNRIPGVHCRVPEGAFYVFPDVSSFGRPARELAGLPLEQAHVALLPGTDFGPGGEGHLRLSTANDWPRIEEGVRRMGALLATL